MGGVHKGASGVSYDGFISRAPNIKCKQFINFPARCQRSGLFVTLLCASSYNKQNSRESSTPVPKARRPSPNELITVPAQVKDGTIRFTLDRLGMNDADYGYTPFVILKESVFNGLLTEIDPQV